ncbi:MAG: hypothetical protein J6P69_02470 [Bacteroidales bacterium]|nr:hypothetical protein [Bacteroidales bacterium]
MLFAGPNGGWRGPVEALLIIFSQGSEVAVLFRGGECIVQAPVSRTMQRE